MALSTYFKIAALQAADAAHLRLSPYEEFTRPALPKSLKTLKARETECFNDLKNFWFFDELMVHRLPKNEGQPPPLDLGDQAIWHGMFTAMLAMKYAVIRDAQERVRVAEMLSKAINGLARHQDYHDEGRPRLIRGYDRNLHRMEDNPSNDSLTGHFAGLYFTRVYGPPDLRLRVDGLLAGIVQELVDNDLWLVNAHGEPTPFGRLIDGIKTDPLQMTLALAIMTVAEHSSLNMSAPRYRHEIYSDYGRMIPYPKVALGNLDNWNDDHRAAMHLAILGLEDRSPAMRKLVRQGVERHWRLFGQRANPWVNALLALAVGDDLPAPIRYGMTLQNQIVLSEYELTDAAYDAPVDRTHDVIVSVTGDHWQPVIKMVKGVPRSTQPLPIWTMGAQDFPWQRHRYSVRDWTGNARPTQRFSGAAYLCAYWASRLCGLIGALA